MTRKPPHLDSESACTHFDHMPRKTVSLDLDVYRRIKGRQSRHESISGTLRRILEEDRDPADYLDGLFRDFGGTGTMTDEGLARVKARRSHPVGSPRPARPQSRRHAP